LKLVKTISPGCRRQPVSRFLDQSLPAAYCLRQDADRPLGATCRRRPRRCPRSRSNRKDQLPRFLNSFSRGRNGAAGLAGHNDLADEQIAPRIDSLFYRLFAQMPCIRRRCPGDRWFELFHYVKQRSDGNVPAQMHNARDSARDHIRAADKKRKIERVKITVCRRMPMLQYWRDWTFWKSTKSLFVNGLSVGTPVEPLDAETNTMSASGTATMSPRSEPPVACRGSIVLSVNGYSCKSSSALKFPALGHACQSCFIVWRIIVGKPKMPLKFSS